MFFAIPGSKHACPNNAACWSPASPAIGISAPPKVCGSVCPYTQLEGFTSGSIDLGIPNSLKISSSHFKSFILYSKVLEALE